MNTGITKIIRVKALDNGSPARVNRVTGECYLTDKFYTFPELTRKFILFHEAGHVATQSPLQKDADNYAFEAFIKCDYSLRATIKALSEVLNARSPESRDRIFQQIKRAVNHDYFINHNHKLESLMRYINGQGRAVDTSGGNPYNTQSHFEDYENFEDFDDDDFNPEEFADFCETTGMSPFSDMSRKEYRKEKRQGKIDKTKAKNEIKLARADAKRTKADAKKSLADQGIDSSVGKQIGDGVGGLLGGIFGKKGGGEAAGGDEGAAGAGAGGTQAAATGSPMKKYSFPRLIPHT